MLNAKCSMLVELFGFDGDVLFAGGALFPVLAHPGFEAFAGRGIAASERERSDVGESDRDLFVPVPWKEADGAVSEGFAGAAIEDVALDLRAVLQRDGDVAAVVEGFL